MTDSGTDAHRHLREEVRAMQLSGNIVYGGMAAAYLLAIFGLEESIVFGVLAIGYLILAFIHVVRRH